MTRRRFQIRFSKTGDLRWLGHLDLVRAWERLLRRAAVPLAMSAGFHSRPRISFPSALPMGEAGTDEIVEIEIDGLMSREELHASLAAWAPPGLCVSSIVEIDSSASATVHEVAYEYPLRPGSSHDVAQRVERLLSQTTLPVQRRAPVARSAGPAKRPGRDEPRAERIVNQRELLLGATVEGNVLRFRLRVRREGSLRAKEVLAALELGDSADSEAFATRTRVLLAAPSGTSAAAMATTATDHSSH